MKTLTFLFFTVLSMTFFACKFSSDKKKMTLNDSLSTTKSWIRKDLKNESFFLPRNWKVVKQNSSYYFSYLDNGNPATYFAIIKYDTNTTSITPLKYLKTTYIEGIKDRNELFTGFTVKKFTINELDIYNAELYSKINGENYIAYSMIFTKNNVFYDIGLKVLLSESPTFKYLYNDIVFSFKIDGENIFDQSYVIKNEQVIDLSKIP